MKEQIRCLKCKCEFEVGFDGKSDVQTGICSKCETEISVSFGRSNSFVRMGTMCPFCKKKISGNLKSINLGAQRDCSCGAIGMFSYN